MPKLAGEPLTKVTMNLFASDVDWLGANLGWGWSEQIRGVVRRYIREVKAKNEEEGIYE